MFPSQTRILICDDMPAIRDMVSRELRRLGYQDQVIAADGEEAWGIFEKASYTSDPFGLIISDWNMPQLTGLQFLKKVRSSPKGAKTPFVLLTAEGQKEQVLEAISCGVTQYILKPFSSKNFEDKLLSAWTKASSSPS